MPILTSEIQIRLTGGASNSDPNLSLGGAVSSTALVDNTLHNLFDEVGGSESLAGDIEYRIVAVRNGNSSLTMKNTKVYISQDSTNANSELDIALDGNGLNTEPETLTDESDTPTGETFTHPTDYAGGLNMGNIPNGQYYGLHFRRTITAGAGASTPDEARFKVDCDTDA